MVTSSPSLIPPRPPPRPTAPSPRLQAKRRIGEVATCDDAAAVVTRRGFDAHLARASKQRFASSTIMSKKVGRPRTMVDFKSTPLESLTSQERVVQFLFHVECVLYCISFRRNVTDTVRLLDMQAWCFHEQT